MGAKIQFKNERNRVQSAKYEKISIDTEACGISSC